MLCTLSQILGNALAFQEQDSVAFEMYKKAVNEPTNNTLKKSHIYHNMGNLTYAGALREMNMGGQNASQGFQQAVDLYKSALRLNPNDNETRYNLAMAQHQLKKSQQGGGGNNDKNKDKDKDKEKQRLAPHKAAMMKIQQIKEEKIWQSEDSKEYYTQLTDTLRQYINERYGFNAMEMTTSEIIEHLQEVNDENAIAELRELFETADLVKFAKYSTLINENDRNLVNAIEYINSTKKEEPAVQQPEEIVIVEKRSKVAKNVLLASVTAASIALLFTAGYLIYRIIMLNV